MFIERVLNFWCFSPGVSLNALRSLGVSCLVLSSGTFNPLNSFADQLHVPFSVRLENPHVIKNHQIWLSAIKKGPRGLKLNSSYRYRDTIEYKGELGRALAQVCSVVPDGLLVLFPSWYAMEGSLEFWENTVIKSMITRNKELFLEPRSSKDLGETVAKYSKACQDRGAVLFCVCRGKMSEGINFADARCRAVVITGLPFPPVRDARVCLKRQYLDVLAARSQARKVPLTATQAFSSQLSGAKWYSQQASRAVNQAVGRVIRHKRDFGAVILLDERFSYPSQKAVLLKWLRTKHKIYDNSQNATQELSQFFKVCKRDRNLRHELTKLPREVRLRTGSIVNGFSNTSEAISFQLTSTTNTSTYSHESKAKSWRKTLGYVHVQVEYDGDEGEKSQLRRVCQL